MWLVLRGEENKGASAVCTGVMPQAGYTLPSRREEEARPPGGRGRNPLKRAGGTTPWEQGHDPLGAGGTTPGGRRHDPPWGRRDDPLGAGGTTPLGQGGTAPLEGRGHQSLTTNPDPPPDRLHQ